MINIAGMHAARVQKKVQSSRLHSIQNTNLIDEKNAHEPRACPEKSQQNPLLDLPSWHYRGRYPHCEYQFLQFITYRLYDSVPRKVIDLWKNELEITAKTNSNDPKMQELRKRIDKYEDAGYGQCFLKDNRIASMVQDNFLHFDGEKYNLLNWCIMPNHVHILIEVLNGWTLSSIMHGWRSYTAHQANKILKRTGDFWMDEYFDRFIRDEKHLESVVNYINNNPVKAGLINGNELWKWSSLGVQSARLQDKSDDELI